MIFARVIVVASTKTKVVITMMNTKKVAFVHYAIMAVATACVMISFGGHFVQN